MANERNRQIKKVKEGQDLFREISDAVWERVTDESRPVPASMNILALELVKDEAVPQHMTNEEKSFFRQCLNSAIPGEFVSQDEFFYRNWELIKNTRSNTDKTEEPSMEEMSR